MKTTIDIKVVNRMLTVMGNPVVLCNNDDYVIVFEFDSEWDAYPIKTARFVVSAKGATSNRDVIFTGNEVKVPIMQGIDSFQIGVFADDVIATPSVQIKCRKSVLCGLPVPLPPDPEIYNKIVAEFENVHGNNAFIKFSHNADGSDFTDIWEEGQQYIGFATGLYEPTTPEGYEWTYISRGPKGEKGDKGDKGDPGITDVSGATTNELGDSEELVLTQKGATDAIGGTMLHTSLFEKANTLDRLGVYHFHLGDGFTATDELPATSTQISSITLFVRDATHKTLVLWGTKDTGAWIKYFTGTSWSEWTRIVDAAHTSDLTVAHAATADKATKDVSGRKISETYETLEDSNGTSLSTNLLTFAEGLLNSDKKLQVVHKHISLTDAQLKDKTVADFGLPPNANSTRYSSATIFVRWGHIRILLWGAITGAMYYNAYSNGSWAGWRKVIDTNTIGSQSVSYAASAGLAERAVDAVNAEKATRAGDADHADRATVADVATKANSVYSEQPYMAVPGMWDATIPIAFLSGDHVFYHDGFGYNPETKTLVVKNLEVEGQVVSTDLERVTLADRATGDENGLNIAANYARVSALTNGTLVPAKASKAVTADKATQDANGLTIHTHYASKNDLTEGDVVPAYTSCTLMGEGDAIMVTFSNGIADFSSTSLKGGSLYAVRLEGSWGLYALRTLTGVYFHINDNYVGEASLGRLSISIQDRELTLFETATGEPVSNFSGRIGFYQIGDVKKS